ncbi:MAG: 12-oxophytodienoate reductase [Alteromonadaceae bacterium]|uniref:NADH:flavin oxidoreductase n=1 Tax=unclassified Marinobacter TaxID=83889 RepID=UPI000C4C4F01|nr:NADH:flavin oxidoreductase [Marinobacter sp. BGYM27]MAA65474.1 12-oxophytodienoate reductase [Alteromonadaceae bacterium]MBH86895.1 12-oxophytodienoate reductase [Alteromonadaceae bacterium]MDG5501222.1 NADH:flavin oxidoreductase [Marinobacter sp. BGYM27]|tara:strand:+ start:48723 stop:49835 length:1113 start_codon:yes stop_codon:yes gene_type:complete
MTMNLGPLFEPFELQSLSLRNRVAMAPMTRNFSPGNVPGENVVDYYRRRAEGGIGLLITEGTTVNHPAANGYENVPAFHGTEALAGWKKVVDAVHEAGGKIFPQLWHVGAVRKEGMEPDPSVPGYSPSGLYAPGKANGKAMSKEDIADVVNAFADAAQDAKALGFDGVEIHGAHGYIIDQFFWEGTNQRDDEYGGSMLNRQRFAIEIIEAVRQRVGPDFPIMLRFSQWKMQDYDAKLANTPEELEAFLKPLVEAGVDIFHASTRRFWETEFEGSNLNLAGWTQKLSGKPTMSVGSVGLTEDFISGTFASKKEAVEQSGIDELVERMNNNEFDLVAVGRALLQDPDWLVKVKEGRIGEVEPFAKKSLKELY